MAQPTPIHSQHFGWRFLGPNLLLYLRQAMHRQLTKDRISFEEQPIVLRELSSNPAEHDPLSLVYRNFSNNR